MELSSLNKCTVPGSCCKHKTFPPCSYVCHRPVEKRGGTQLSTAATPQPDDIEGMDWESEDSGMDESDLQVGSSRSLTLFGFYTTSHNIPAKRFWGLALSDYHRPHSYEIQGHGFV